MFTGIVTLVLATLGCWLEPVNPPRAEWEDKISRVWAGHYQGYASFSLGPGFGGDVREVDLRIHSHNHNRVSFECTIYPGDEQLSPELRVEGEVRDTTRLRIVNYFPDVLQIVDLWRTPEKIYGGMVTNDYNGNRIWQLERLEVRPVDEE